MLKARLASHRKAPVASHSEVLKSIPALKEHLTKSKQPLSTGVLY